MFANFENVLKDLIMDGAFIEHPSGVKLTYDRKIGRFVVSTKTKKYLMSNVKVDTAVEVFDALLTFDDLEITPDDDVYQMVYRVINI